MFSAERSRVPIDGHEMSLSLSDILMWLTGSLFRPVADLKIKVYFDVELSLPVVNTCGPSLRLPLGIDLSNARRSVSVFTHWLLDSPGFGQL